MVFEEIAVNVFLQSFSTPLLDTAFKAITYLGNPAFWFIIAAWLFWIGKEKKSLAVICVILFVGIIAGALKVIFARARPSGIRQIVLETGYSFPSGHATISGAFATYGYISKWVWKNVKYILILMAIAVAISRMYLGVHYISDVLAGLLIGIFIGWLVVKLEGKLEKTRFHISKVQEEFGVILLFAILTGAYFFVPEMYSAAYAILGYLAGYAVFRHTKIDLEIKKAKSRSMQLVLIVIGTIIIGGAGYFADKNGGSIGDLLFFISGLFITIIWPAIMNAIIAKKQAHLRA